MAKSLKKASGFTILELMVVLAIIGVIATFAVPGFFRWMNNYRLKSAALDLYTNIHLAKMRAIKMSANCIVAFNNTGYQVYEDANNNRSFDAGEKIIANVSWDKYATVNLIENTLPGNMVIFTRGGLTRGVASTDPVTGTVRLKGSTGRELTVMITGVGNVRIE